jgi:flagellar hook-length control protein FliK
MNLSALLSTVAAPQGSASATGKTPGAAVPNAGFAALLAQLGSADSVPQTPLPTAAANLPLNAEAVNLPAADLATLMQQLVDAGLNPATDQSAPATTPQQQTAAAPLPTATPEQTLRSLLDALQAFAPPQTEAATAELDAGALEQDMDDTDTALDDSELDALPPALVTLLQQLGVVRTQEPAAATTAAAPQEALAAAVQSAAPSVLPSAPTTAATAAAEPAPQVALAAPLDAAQQQTAEHKGATHSQATTELLNLMTQAGAESAESAAFTLPAVPVAAPATHSAQPALPASAPTTTMLLPQPVDTPQWRAEFSQQVARIALKQGDQRMSLQLHPTELGPLTVELRVRDGQADIQFLSPHMQVRSAVVDALPQLREALSHQGIELGNANVGGQERQGQSQAAREQEFAQGQPFDLNGTPASENDAAASAARAPQAPRGLVNLYV